VITRSVAAGFGQHGMPPPVSNDICTALGLDGSQWSRDLATLTFDLGGHGACGWCGSIVLHKYTKFELRRSRHSEDMADDVCHHWWAWYDLDLLPFDLETGMRVTSELWILLPNFRPLNLWVLELMAMWTTDGRRDEQRDGQTDKSNAYCPLPYVWGITI